MCNSKKKVTTPCACRPAILPKWKNIFKDPPDPLLLKLSPLPVHYHRVRIYFWIPDYFYYHIVPHLPCPHCISAHNVKIIGWNETVLNRYVNIRINIILGTSNKLNRW
jgi:hypothetical protein